MCRIAILELDGKGENPRLCGFHELLFCELFVDVLITAERRTVSTNGRFQWRISGSNACMFGECDDAQNTPLLFQSGCTPALCQLLEAHVLLVWCRCSISGAARSILLAAKAGFGASPTSRPKLFEAAKLRAGQRC